jgi:hypothetical protein
LIRPKFSNSEFVALEEEEEEEKEEEEEEESHQSIWC